MLKLSLKAIYAFDCYQLLPSQIEANRFQSLKLNMEIAVTETGQLTLSSGLFARMSLLISVFVRCRLRFEPLNFVVIMSLWVRVFCFLLYTVNVSSAKREICAIYNRYLFVNTIYILKIFISFHPVLSHFYLGFALPKTRVSFCELREFVITFLPRKRFNCKKKTVTGLVVWILPSWSIVVIVAALKKYSNTTLVVLWTCF